ncbi:hypothetical protein GCM10027093_66820 [Paraburkholderia jirisanensis]
MQNLALTAFSDTLGALRGELSLARITERTPQCITAVTATVLATYLAHWFGLHEIWWSAVCAFAITGQDAKTSLNQGIQQILGTIGGTAFGLILSNYVDGEAGLFVFSVTCIAAAGLYLATSRAASYMWILSTSLAIYVLTAARTSPNTSTIAIAEALGANALVGSMTYWAVNRVFGSVMSATGFGSRKAAVVTASPALATAPFNVAFVRARNVFAGALTTCILAYFAYRHPVDGFVQAMTTALVILVVPLHIHQDRSTYMVVLRMLHRLLGCLLGSVIACVVLPIATGNALYCTLALCVAIWFSCHLRFGDSSIAYAGTQCGAVIILAFVHDEVWFSDTVGIAYGRLTGIVFGTVALALVLAVVSSVLACSRFSRGSG